MEEASVQCRGLGVVDEQAAGCGRTGTLSGMIYRLGFWIGPSPAKAEEACADLYTRVLLAEEIWREFDRPPPPVPRILRFAEAVLERFPNDGSRNSLWKHTDVADDAMTDTFTPTIHGPYREAIAILTRLAQEHEVCAFDLTAHRVLSVTDLMDVDGVLSTRAHLGGGDDDPEFFDCRGPEIARERLGLPATGPYADADADADEDGSADR